MEKFYIRLADKVVAISANYATTKQFCRDYLLDELPSKVDIEVNVTQEAMEFEREEAKKTGMFSDRYLETLAVHRQVAEQMTKYHTVLFHGSAIAVDGEVYLFTAPSGTGKSTHTRLWRERFGDRAFMVNDDKPFLHLEEDGSITVYGAPWDGKHHLSRNLGLPLKVICILEQAPENQIQRLSQKESFQTIYLQTYRTTQDAVVMKHTLEVLSGIMRYPIWHLGCTISQEAVSLSYEAMSGKKMEE